MTQFDPVICAICPIYAVRKIWGETRSSLPACQSFCLTAIIYTYMPVRKVRIRSFLWVNWAETWVGGGGTP